MMLKSRSSPPKTTYTQALALQAEASVLYGKGSEQATRATTAANYVGALYTQSKKDEVVAQELYYTATATNLAKIASSFTVLMSAMQAFQISTTILTSETISNAEKVALAAIPIIGTVAALGFTAYQILSQPSPTLSAPSMQTGGYVGRTGQYFLHQGETVVPNSQGGGGSPSASIVINATSNVDLARVRQEVEAALAKTMLHSQKQRGVY